MTNNAVASGISRLAAAFIAVIAWAGLILNFTGLLAQGISTPAALWALLHFFTITTNLGIAILFAALATGRLTLPRVTASLTLAILLVGIVYALLLHGLIELSGGSAIANVLLHMITPVLVPLYWMIWVEKGALRTVDPFLFALYPAVYLIYAILRGQIDGKYPYPFIDVGRLGWPQTMLNASMIAVGFVLVSWGFVYLDRKMAAARSTSF